MFGRIGIFELIMLPMVYLIPAIILYFIIKLAVKNAITELKRGGIL